MSLLLDTQSEYSRLSETVTKYELKSELQLARSELRLELIQLETRMLKWALVVVYGLIVLFLIMLAATRPEGRDRHSAATNTSVAATGALTTIEAGKS